MTVDLLQVLPDFSTAPYTHILPSLDKHLITTSDLLTLDAFDIAKRAVVPPGEVKKLADAVLRETHRQLGLTDDEVSDAHAQIKDPVPGENGTTGSAQWSAISTLDDQLDAALGGGIPPGCVVEVTGESGAGKTQFLLTLLLSAQLPAPHGLAKSAVYISTEAVLATTRLAQLLNAHPHFSALSPEEKPSLSRVLSIQTPDLESQDHILRYQLPVAIKRHGVGLVVIDSIAANYRAEFDRPDARPGAFMAKRSAHLVQLGALLRDMARIENIVIVVANQVADRFTPQLLHISNPLSRTASVHSQSDRDIPSSQNETRGTPQEGTPLPLTSADPLSFDHQQRWFTGWGDDPSPAMHAKQGLKTPSLGLVWTNQIACRIALIKEPVYSAPRVFMEENAQGEWEASEPEIVRWRRWFKLVFAPWAAPAEGRGTEFEILGSGIRSFNDS